MMRVKAAVLATLAVVNGSSDTSLAVALSKDDLTECIASLTPWTFCSNETGLQERHSSTCLQFVEIRECKKKNGCGAFTQWEPSDVSCSRGQKQTRRRTGCEKEVEEVKVCRGVEAICSDRWTPWTFCDKRGLQERSNADCDLVEVRSCQDSSVEEECGPWSKWEPEYVDGKCALGKAYSRNREKCADVMETHICGSKSCADCDVNSTCDPLEGRCRCITGYEGSGFECSLINPCRRSPCDPTAGCQVDGLKFKCICPKGMTGDEEAGPSGQPCVDEDECTTGNFQCPRSSVCRNTNGSYECDCLPGYRKENGMCVDIDECTEGEAECSDNSTCVNSKGSYSCACNSGYTGEGSNKNPCRNVNECLTEQPCAPLASCADTEGSYQCSCPAGYSGEGTHSSPCAHIDFCANSTLNNCGPHSTCVNEMPSFKCVCNAGYFGEGTTTSPCKDIDECNISSPAHDCDTNAICTNTDGSFTCKCGRGYEGSGVTGGCADIDECALGRPCGENSLCENTAGTYLCYCEDGFVDESHTGKSCHDVDECELGTHNCHVSAKCTNTAGSFTCKCKDGFIGTGVTCDDVDECGSASSPCGENTKCVNTVGSYECSCKEGYGGMDAERNCSNINECNTNVADVPENSTCVDTVGSYDFECKPGFEKVGNACRDIDWCGRRVCNELADCKESADGVSYTCTCKSGYSGDGTEAGVCVDINECEGQNECSSSADGGICHNTAGSYTCSCSEGYSQTGTKCSDIDECSNGSHTCHGSAICTNTKGSYTCECVGGFSGSGKECTDVNECADGTHDCGSNSVCQNTVGSFSCLCKDGYQHSGEKACVDIDECLGENTCSLHAACINAEGSYTCECNPGFSGDGRQCDDINFCGTGHNDCNELAECSENESGTGNICTCEVGYQGDGRGLDGCSDIDECSTGAASCPQNSTCKNTVGSYICTCNMGYLGSGGSTLSCVDIDECKDTASNTCASAESGGSCTNTDGSYSCSCIAGYSGDGRNCVDVNECEARNECTENTNCKNTRGSYTCECKAGYTRVDERSCEDINECTVGTAVVPANSKCVNNDGSYDFECDHGFRKNGGECLDIDFCAEAGCSEHSSCVENKAGTEAICTCENGFRGNAHSKGGCINVNECDEGGCDKFGDGGKCRDTVGSYECSCTDGYVLSGGRCVDVDECESAKLNNCSVSGGICTNTVGSFTCSCKKGFSGDGVMCVDVDECKTNGHDCHINAICTNNVGSFSCACSAGYSGDGRRCVDIDECSEASTNVCDTHRATCTNTDGSYTCACVDGFSGNGVDCTNVDECVTNVYDCQSNSRCVDTVGSYNCECEPGYRKNGEGICTDVDECAAETFDCHADAHCTNNVGSFDCTCNEGYKGDGRDCISKTNPCDVQPCGSNASCTPIGGSETEYSCTCHKGYSMAENKCVDVDECVVLTHNCSPYASCSNTDGSFTCECKSGFGGDGIDCDDINECVEGTHSCDENAKCHNSSGSYKCKCNDGYMGNGKACTSIDQENPDGMCKSWSPWSLCSGGTTHTTRYCIEIPSKVDRKECDNSELADCGVFGPWTECSETDFMRSRQRENYGTVGCDDAKEQEECVNDEMVLACGEWGNWSLCGLPSTGLKMRHRVDCPSSVEYAFCDSSEVDGNAGGPCLGFSAWSECGVGAGGVMSQTRFCLNNSGVVENRRCAAESICGEYGNWSSCEGNVQSRSRDGCSSVVETRVCGDGGAEGNRCGEWSKFSKCRISIGGKVYKSRQRGGCDESELVECTKDEIAGDESEITPGDENEDEVAPGVSGKECKVWSLWSACTDGVETRECVKGITAKELRPCAEDVSGCGEWSAYLPEACTGVETVTRSRDCEGKTQTENIVCENKPEKECEYNRWSACGLDVGGVNVSCRMSDGCEDSAECKVCEPSGSGKVCGLWEECNGGSQKRSCELRRPGEVEVVEEIRGCRVETGCGEWLEWSECNENGIEVRATELCDEVQESRVCGAGNCKQFGNWSACGVPTEGIRVRNRSDCSNDGPCFCAESENCSVPEPSTSTSTPPPEEEKSEEGGFPTAAVAGGVAGVLLIAAIAGGGAAYSRRGGNSESSGFDDYDFEATEAGAEEPSPEGDTVIDITEEDDYWADGDQ